MSSFRVNSRSKSYSNATERSLKILLLSFCPAILLLARPSLQHGRLFEPPSRNTMWRFGYKSAPNYNDNELFCGGIGAIVRNAGKCGVCGDAFDGPRLHETGQQMAPNKTVRNYFPGSSIDLIVDIVANHGGTFEFEMCWRDQWSKPETEDCFELLQMSPRSPDDETVASVESEPDSSSADSGSDSGELADYYELDPSAGTGAFSMSVQLPANKTCENCILRWHWRTANNWGLCEDGTEQIGCGYQEIYRNCADISVKRDGSGIGLSRK